MADVSANPFSEEDKRRMEESLLELDEAEKLLTKGKLAGLDLSEQEKRLRETRQRLRKVHQVFFPNG